MESLSKLEIINLLVIIIKRVHKLMTVKYGKHRMSYGYFLNKVFDHFKVECVKGMQDF